MNSAVRLRAKPLAVGFAMAVSLILTASLSFACTTMGGQTYLATINGNAAGAGPYSASQGASVGAYATGVSALPSGQGSDYTLMEDPQGSYCMGTASGISTDSPSTYGRGSGNIGSSASPKFGTLKTGTMWTGVMQVCFSNSSYSAWPVDITVS